MYFILNFYVNYLIWNDYKILYKFYDLNSKFESSVELREILTSKSKRIHGFD